MACESEHDYTNLCIQQELLTNLYRQVSEHKIPEEAAIIRLANALSIQSPIVDYLRATVGKENEPEAL